METVVIGVAGMHCQACVKNVSTVLAALPGVAGVDVSLAAGQASVSYDPTLASAANFCEAIEAAGFDAT